MTVQWKTSSAQSGRKTCRGQSRRWRSPNLQECKRRLCMYHWTECDAAVLKEHETKFGLFFIFLWHIMSCFVKGGTQDLWMVEWRLFCLIFFLHCNFHILFLPFNQWALFTHKKKGKKVWLLSKPLLSKWSHLSQWDSLWKMSKNEVHCVCLYRFGLGGVCSLWGWVTV